MLSPVRSCRPSFLAPLTAILIVACLYAQSEFGGPTATITQRKDSRIECQERSDTPSAVTLAEENQDDPEGGRQSTATTRRHKATRCAERVYARDKPLCSWRCSLKTWLIPAALNARAPPLTSI